MITIDYQVNKPVTYQNIEVGQSRAHVRETFESDSNGMARFEDLQTMHNEGIMEGGIQLTWSPAEVEK